jgi:hypothetical protein
MCTITSHAIKYRIKNKYRTDKHPFASNRNVDITVIVHRFLSLSSHLLFFYCLFPTSLLTSIFISFHYALYIRRLLSIFFMVYQCIINRYPANVENIVSS